MESRSQNGCWTCRVRKRKCDEKLPVCSECQSLKLDCHGYLEKPTWMDRGAKQKEQADKIKKMVAQVRKQRRLNQIPSRHEILRKRSHPRSTHSRESSTNSTTSLSSIETPTSPQTPTTFPRHTHDSHEPYPSPLSPKLFQQDNGDPRFSLPEDTLSSDFFIAEPTSSVLQFSMGEIQYPLNDGYVLEDVFVSPQELHLPPKDFISYDSRRISNLSSEIFQRGGSCTAANTKFELVFDKIEDAILLAHYFEKVFNWQFQFCELQQPEFSQGNILWLASESKSLYHAILALSSSYKSIWMEESGTSSTSSTSNEQTPHFSLAVSDLQNDLQDPKAYKDTWLLASIVTFLHSALLQNSRTIDWQLYLQAGTSIVSVWVEQMLGPCTSHESGTQCTDEKSKIEPTRVFLIGSMIRFDILSSLTRSSKPVLSEQYQRLLQIPCCGISVEAVLGCQNWVMRTVLKVYSLRDWKEEARTVGTLSMWELMWKAQEIKQSLEVEISLNLEKMNKYKQEPSNDKGENKEYRHSLYDVLVVTHIFACAVSILLEVVVSGAWPKLPEIKHEVSRAIESYAYINNPDLLHVLRWPLYVAGCLATPEQQEFFRSILSSPNVTRIGIFQESLELIEECWQMSRDVGSSNAGLENSPVHRFLTRDDILIA